MRRRLATSRWRLWWKSVRPAAAQAAWPPAEECDGAAGRASSVMSRSFRSCLPVEPGWRAVDVGGREAPERRYDGLGGRLCDLARRCRHERLRGAAPGAARVGDMGERGSASLACGRGLRSGVVAAGRGRRLEQHPGSPRAEWRIAGAVLLPESALITTTLLGVGYITESL